MSAGTAGVGGERRHRQAPARGDVRAAGAARHRGMPAGRARLVRDERYGTRESTNLRPNKLQAVL